VKKLNDRIREDVNPHEYTKPELKHGSRIFRLGDRVLQTRNMDDISNGDVGFVKSVYIGEDNDSSITVFFGDGRCHEYGTDELEMLELAYAMTIHKSQGSEYDTVIIPMMSSHYIMLRRNLIYTAITRAKKKVIIVGQKKALYMAINKNDIDGRNTRLAERIQKLRQE
jgi:exodeoxyribonuclease V alpha subunit